jgi:hypothetical protein
MTVQIRSFQPLLAVAALGFLSGCGTVETLMPHYNPSSFNLNQGANPRPVGQPAARPGEKPKALPATSLDINCPEVEIPEGGAALRVGGADNASVRYQFNIGDTARECDPAGPGQATIKIGVAGNVVVGPAGSAGTYSVPLRITITNLDDKKPVFTNTYRIEATTDGVAAGVFRMVTDPIPVPMPTLQLANLYSISVGFEGGNAPAEGRRKRKAH